MTNPYLKNKLHQQLWARAYAKNEKEVLRSIEEQQRSAALFPSSVPGGRQAVSPLGGVARPAAEKEPG